MSGVVIYGLMDPRTEVVRYVGKSVDPARRLSEHLRGAARRRTHKECWLHSLQREGLTPVVVILQDLRDDENWEGAERAWIASLPGLTNGTTGGEGGYVPAAFTPEIIARRSESNRGKRRTEAFRQARREEMLTRAPQSQEVRERIAATLTGRTLSAEVKAKVSASTLGVRKSATHAENIGRAKRGELHPTARLTKEAVLQIRSLAAAGVSQANLACRFAVDPSHINKIVHRKVWRHI